MTAKEYYIELVFSPPEARFGERAEAFADAIAEAFADVADVDGDVAADLGSGELRLCVSLNACSSVEALQKTVTACRAVAHAAGGSTPGWENGLQSLLDEGDFAADIARPVGLAGA